MTRYVVFKPVGKGYVIPFSTREIAETWARALGELMEDAANTPKAEFEVKHRGEKYGTWIEAYYPPEVMVENIIEAEDAIGQEFDGGSRSAYIRPLPAPSVCPYTGNDMEPHIAYIKYVPDAVAVEFHEATEEEVAKYCR